jgi:hypothetical protein
VCSVEQGSHREPADEDRRRARHDEAPTAAAEPASITSQTSATQVIESPTVETVEPAQSAAKGRFRRSSR